MKKILSYLQDVENFIMILSFSIMVFCVFAQVVNRNFIKAPIVWFDELATYSMIYMVLIGTEVGLRDGTQIAVQSLVDKLHGKAKGIVQIIAKLVVVAFSANVFKCGLDLVLKQVETGQTSPALHLPMSVPYTALVISFGIIAVVQTAEVISMIIAIVKGKTGEGVEA
ncbi:TRAP transporter small permease [Clostridium sporogenes]|jgi:C4-dicarboxylate transporter DctM subunit|uniref:TRAP transporter small permease n=1 Tax=Clostridium sporogenes TaxID=1509 RepID=UPI0030110D60|nr:TRAP transporter small permease [Pseudobutyrivibrio ruminis]